MRFAVIGAGAIGSFVGASLAEAGFDVTLVGRGQHHRAMQAKPLEIEGVRRSFSVRVRAVDALADAGLVDVVLLTVKAHHLTALAVNLSPLLHATTTIVTMQNGIPFWYFSSGGGPLAGQHLESVDPGGAIARAIGVERIIGGAVYSGARLLAPGVVRQSGDLDYRFGEPDGATTQRLTDIVATFVAAGIDAVADPDIRRTIWTKLLGNATFNPISALTRATAAEMVDDPAIVALIGESMAEQIALGERIGVQVDVSIEARIARTRILGSQRTSMLQDVEAGRRLEIEPILGAVVEIGDRLGAPVAATRRLYSLVSLLDRSLAEAQRHERVEA